MRMIVSWPNVWITWRLVTELAFVACDSALVSLSMPFYEQTSKKQIIDSSRNHYRCASTFFHVFICLIKYIVCTWSTLLLFGVTRGDNPFESGDTPSNDLRLLLRRLPENCSGFSFWSEAGDPKPIDFRRLLLWEDSCGDNPFDRRDRPSNDLRLLLRRLAERSVEFSLSIKDGDRELRDLRRLFTWWLGESIIILPRFSLCGQTVNVCAGLC